MVALLKSDGALCIVKLTACTVSDKEKLSLGRDRPLLSVLCTFTEIAFLWYMWVKSVIVLYLAHLYEVGVFLT